jgi:hypothetical protein
MRLQRCNAIGGVLISSDRASSAIPSVMPTILALRAGSGRPQRKIEAEKRSDPQKAGR